MIRNLSDSSIISFYGSTYLVICTGYAFQLAGWSIQRGDVTWRPMETDWWDLRILFWKIKKCPIGLLVAGDNGVRIFHDGRHKRSICCACVRALVAALVFCRRNAPQKKRFFFSASSVRWSRLWIFPCVHWPWWWMSWSCKGNAGREKPSPSFLWPTVLALSHITWPAAQIMGQLKHFFFKTFKIKSRPQTPPSSGAIYNAPVPWLIYLIKLNQKKIDLKGKMSVHRNMGSGGWVHLTRRWSGDNPLTLSTVHSAAQEKKEGQVHWIFSKVWCIPPFSFGWQKCFNGHSSSRSTAAKGHHQSGQCGTQTIRFPFFFPRPKHLNGLIDPPFPVTRPLAPARNLMAARCNQSDLFHVNEC